MKQRARLIPIAILLVAILVGTWWWATTASGKNGHLTASGTIEADEIILSAEIGGRVIAVKSEKGDRVSTGDELLRLDQDELLARQESAAATVEQSRAALETAQAQLELALAGAHTDDLAAAQAAVATAQGGLEAAQATLGEAELRADIAADVRQAESAVESAQAGLNQAQGNRDASQANLERAQADLANLQAGARPEEIAIYQAQLDRAEAELYQPTHIYEELVDAERLGEPEEEARYRMFAYQAVRDVAQAQLDLALAGATDNQLAALVAAVSATRAQVAISEASVQMAEATLASAQAALETAQKQADLAQAGVQAARAQVNLQQGQLDQAIAKHDRLQAGSTAEELAVLKAQVGQAEAALSAAQAMLKQVDIQLARTIVVAPSDGVVLERPIQPGELAVPGTPLFTLGDLNDLTITVYVPEDRYGEIELGQEAIVTVDSFPGDPFIASVVHIADQAEFTPRNVQTAEGRSTTVFAIELVVLGGETKLKPGMPADVDFQR